MIRHALLWLFHLFLNFYRFVSCLRPRRAPRPLRASRRKLPKHLAVVLGDYYGDRSRSQMTPRSTELEDTIESVRRLVEWCRVIGVGILSVYDRQGKSFRTWLGGDTNQSLRYLEGSLEGNSRCAKRGARLIYHPWGKADIKRNLVWSEFTPLRTSTGYIEPKITLVANSASISIQLLALFDHFLGIAAFNASRAIEPRTKTIRRLVPSHSQSVSGHYALRGSIGVCPGRSEAEETPLLVSHRPKATDISWTPYRPYLGPSPRKTAHRGNCL